MQFISRLQELIPNLPKFNIFFKSVLFTAILQITAFLKAEEFIDSITDFDLSQTMRSTENPKQNTPLGKLTFGANCLNALKRSV